MSGGSVTRGTTVSVAPGARASLRTPSRLMTVALARQIAGDAAFRPGVTRSHARRQSLTLSVVFAVIAGVVAVVGLRHPATAPAAAGFGVLAVVAGAHARWGDRVAVWMERGAIAARMLTLLLGVAGASALCAAGAVAVVAAVLHLGDSAGPAIGFGVAALVLTSVTGLGVPAFVSLSNVGYVMVLRLYMPVLWSSSAAVTLIAVGQTVVRPSSVAAGVALGVSVFGPVFGLLSGLRSRRRAMTGEFAAAVDEVLVLLATQSDATELMRAFARAELGAAAGGTRLGRRGNRLIDRHIGTVFAVCAQQLTGLPAHLPTKTMQTVLRQCVAAGAEVDGDGFRSDVLAFVVAVRDRLAAA